MHSITGFLLASAYLHLGTFPPQPRAPGRMVAELQELTKAPNSYWLWLKENRDAIAKEAGTRKGSVVSKLAGVKWKALPAEQKKPFEDEAAKWKAAYKRAVEETKAAGGQPGKRRREKMEEKQALADKKAEKEACKASSKPSRPQNAYLLWLKENREAITKEELASEKWKALPAAERKPFEDEAVKLKAAYQKVLEEWKATAGTGVDCDEEEAEEEEEGVDVEAVSP